MEFHKSTYNFERISAGKRAIGGAIPVSLKFFGDGDMDRNRTFFKDSKGILNRCLCLAFTDGLRVKCDFLCEKMPSIIKIRKKSYE